ncbi:tyrosine-specific transport protein 1-like isoform X1 [Cucumis melo var. makuwa]|uniref:Tyrosine-specific transport protein 1-like isoform X1 n=1 Tax=Cucumis melo var. makuwa TaxID=1194695 RepID=A0A5A7T4H8_CUCMM|nr:tyrosine-specific transport protein 1-like isoform X1 [Cucumis melo var. makuwa]
MMKSWGIEDKGFLIECRAMEGSLSIEELYDEEVVPTINESIPALLNKYEDVFNWLEELPPNRGIELPPNRASTTYSRELISSILLSFCNLDQYQYIESLFWCSISLFYISTFNSIHFLPSILGSRDLFSKRYHSIPKSSKISLPLLKPKPSTQSELPGGYCMTMLYGVLPPAMAWAMHSRESEETESKAILRERPALLGLGLFACGIVVEQVIQDILKFQW